MVLRCSGGGGCDCVGGSGVGVGGGVVDCGENDNE
jgi:hypothetical protein